MEPQINTFENKPPISDGAPYSKPLPASSAENILQILKMGESLPNKATFANPITATNHCCGRADE
jgi:hypothetical protein